MRCNRFAIIAAASLAALLTLPVLPASAAPQSKAVGITDNVQAETSFDLSARRRHHHRRHSHRHRGGSVTLAGVVPVLAAKIREIQGACGSRIVSAVRSWGVTPNHREGKAVDVQGNPSCIYAHLHGWPGGYSTDYSRVQHVHISYSRSHEWGMRFSHSGHRSHSRYARRHHGREQLTEALPSANASP